MRNLCRSSIVALAIGVGVISVPGPAVAEGSPSRVGIGGGMGVSYVNANDVAEFVSAVTLERVEDFKTAVEFFGDVDVPLSGRWTLKLEYAYLLGGYAVSGRLGRGEFTIKIHMPTVVAQYALAQEPLYNFRLGAGVGYHIGTLSTQYSTLDDAFTGSGPGFKLDLEGNTALGEDLFARLGVDVRWDFIGDLKNAAGYTPQAPQDTPSPTLFFFGVGAKLGMTWYF